MRIKTFSLIAAASLVLSGVAFAGAKTYQVTGPVLEVNDSMITVQKGKDRWELDRDSNTRSEEHTSELQSHSDLVCRLLLEKKKKKKRTQSQYTSHKDTKHKKDIIQLRDRVDTEH